MNKKNALKNHISHKARRINSLLQNKFGFSLVDVDKALQGDKTALQAIGEAARQGQIAIELMPLLESACTTIQKGTEQYNRSISNILKQGASSAINIDKAVSQAMLANQKYAHQRTELAGEFASNRTAENQRHNYAVNYIQLKAYIDQYLAKVDGNAKLLEQTNRPEIKQFDEDNRYDSAVAKHLLQHGDNARLELLPKREYVQVTEDKKTVTVKETLIQKFGSIMSALGF
jgi:hypothetical protein